MGKDAGMDDGSVGGFEWRKSLSPQMWSQLLHAYTEASSQVPDTDVLARTGLLDFFVGFGEVLANANGHVIDIATKDLPVVCLAKDPLHVGMVKSVLPAKRATISHKDAWLPGHDNRLSEYVEIWTPDDGLFKDAQKTVYQPHYDTANYHEYIRHLFIREVQVLPLQQDTSGPLVPLDTRLMVAALPFTRTTHEFMANNVNIGPTVTLLGN